MRRTSDPIAKDDFQRTNYRRFKMNYTRTLLAQRKAELEEALMIAETISERHIIDVELEQVEAALEDMRILY